LIDTTATSNEGEEEEGDYSFFFLLFSLQTLSELIVMGRGRRRKELVGLWKVSPRWKSAVASGKRRPIDRSMSTTDKENENDELGVCKTTQVDARDRSTKSLFFLWKKQQ
jgi:hypothetical protein